MLVNSIVAKLNQMFSEKKYYFRFFININYIYIYILFYNISGVHYLIIYANRGEMQNTDRSILPQLYTLEIQEVCCQ